MLPFSPQLKSVAAIACESKASVIYANCIVYTRKLLSYASFKQVEILLIELENIFHSHIVRA